MAVLNATQNVQHTNTSAEQIQTDTANLVIGVVILASALIGCSLTLLALGKDFFLGKNPPSVLVSALVWVDFIGAFSTAVLVFHGFVQGPEWIMYSPQCTLQGFFSTAFGISSGAVVTFMSLERAVSLHKPFFYKQHATPCLARAFCIFITLFCVTLSALPFAGVGRYMLSKSSRFFCQFDWFPADLSSTVYILALATSGTLLIFVMTASNIFVFVIVIRIRRQMSAVLPWGENARRHGRRGAFRLEERMAKFVALVSVVFLVTWLPVTIRLFCNVFRVYPSNRLDSLSLKLVVANFLLDPFTYVLFKKNFKRNLKQSITELTEFIGDASFSQRLKKQSSRDNNGNKKGNTSGVGHGRFAKTSMFQDDKPTMRTLNLDTDA